VAVFALVVLVFTLGEIGFSTAGPTLIADLAPVRERGRYQGAFQLAWGLSGVAAPALGSLVLGRFGSRALWLGCLAAGLVAAGLHGTVTARILARRRQPPAARAG
jgi:MFS family permease